MKKFLSLLLVVMLLATLLPAIAVADGLSLDDVWTAFSAKTYKCGDMSFRADTQDGSKVFVFEGIADCPYVCELDTLVISEYDIYPDYFSIYYTGDDYLEIDVYNDNGVICGVIAYGVDFELNNEWLSYDGTYVDPDIAPNGTQFYPWDISAEGSSVTAYVSEGSLLICGEGNMKDFASATDRPWNDVAGTIDAVFFDESITGIGSLAFAGVGTDLAGGAFEHTGVYLPEELTSIGDNAFDGANLEEDFYIRAQVKSIGARAFADTGLKTVTFYADTPVIAADAFTGVTATAYTVNGSSWTDAEMLDYGGNLTWEKMYAVHVIVDYGTEGITGEGTMYIPEGELFEYDASIDCDEFYEFVSWELVSGTLDIGDGSSMEISGVPVDNIELILHLNCIDDPDDGDDDGDVPDDDDDDDDAPGKHHDIVKGDDHTDPTISDGPRTGDTSHKTLWIVIAAVAVAGLVVSGILSKKSKGAAEAPETEEKKPETDAENKE